MNDEKSIIDVYDSKGNVTSMELVFQFKANDMNYIIYKEFDKAVLYAAKFKKYINKDFDSNLTKEELELCNKVYEEMQNDNK